MSIRSERIKQLISQSNLSYVELEKMTGIKKSSLQRYASGETQKIPLDVIEKLSKTFDVSQSYLMGWDDDEEKKTPDKLVLTEGEELLVQLFRRLPDTAQTMYLELLKQTLAPKK